VIDLAGTSRGAGSRDGSAVISRRYKKKPVCVDRIASRTTWS
jgi:hypothetical protein